MLQQGYPVGRLESPPRAHRHGLHPMGLPRGLHTVLTQGSAPQVGSPQHHQAWEQARCALENKRKQFKLLFALAIRTKLLYRGFLCNPKK